MEGVDPILGCQFGAYVVESLIGAGGMGRVYRAHHEKLGRAVALKILPQQVAADEQYMQRFIREAKITSTLQHPNLVQVYDFGTSEHGNYIAMELVEGASLADVIKSQGRLPEEDLLHIARQMLSALAYAHEAGVVHRDVKPDNILICKDTTIRLADLGLAKATLVDEDSSLTMSGMILGTPHYMPPEQIQGSKDIDGRADLYALGGTLLHCATGRPPFTGDTSVAIMNKHLSELPPNPKFLVPELSEDFSRFVLRLMQKNPEYRYANANAAGKVVADIINGTHKSSGESVTFVEEESFADRLKEWAPTVLVLLLLAGAGVAAWKWIPHSKPLMSAEANDLSRPTDPPLPMATGPSRDLPGELPAEGLGSPALGGRHVLTPKRSPKRLVNRQFPAGGVAQDFVFQGEPGQTVSLTQANTLMLSSTQHVFVRWDFEEIQRQVMKEFNQVIDFRKATLFMPGKITTTQPSIIIKLFCLTSDPRESFTMASAPIAVLTLPANAGPSLIQFEISEDVRRILKNGENHGWVLTTEGEGQVEFSSASSPNPDAAIAGPQLDFCIAAQNDLIPESTLKALGPAPQ